MFLRLRINRIAYLLVPMLLAGLSGPAARGQVVPAGEADAVGKLLSRLGLLDLQIALLEDQLDAATDAKPRQTLAKRLGDLYAERLMGTAEDNEKYEDTLRRIDALLVKVPEANTPALQVMLLQADYARGEKLYNKWVDDPSAQAAFEDAKKILSRIAPKLRSYHKELRQARDKFAEEVDKLENEAEQLEKEPELRRLNGFAARASFYAGWSNYYFALCKQNLTAAKTELDNARDSFREILSIAPDDKYNEVEVDWLNLGNIHRANALIGLGLVEAALGNLKASRACFAFLEDVSAPPSIRDHTAYWFLRGLLNAGLTAEALAHAENHVKTFAGRATQGKVRYCVALVRAGFAARNPTKETRRLGMLGVQGLARLGEFSPIRLLMSEYEIELPEKNAGFYLTWLKGQQQFIQADSSKLKKDYQAASKTLVAALKNPESATDLLSSGQCRFELAWCYFSLKEYEDAAIEFTKASAALKEGSRAKAIEAGYLAFRSYYELSRDNKRFTPSAIDALQHFKNEFPDAPQAKQADYLLAKLKQSVDSLDVAITSLQKVKPGDDKYLSALSELCLLHYQQWSKVRADAKKAGAAAPAVFAAVDKYLAAARRDSDKERQLKCAMFAVDVALRSVPPNSAKAKKHLNQAQPLVQEVSSTSSKVQEYHYHQMQLAKQSGDTTAIRSHGDWLVENAKGSAYERSALITVANDADKAAKSASASQRGQREAEAARVYGRLSTLFGNSKEILQANKNARVAASKAADYEYRIGDFDRAARRLERLVAAFPSSPNYLRRAGLAQFQAGKFSKALPHWRTLTAGSKKNSADWYEAKYYQISCLAKTDPPTARKVHKQFRLLHPKVNLDGWREKFKALDSELGR